MKFVDKFLLVIMTLLMIMISIVVVGLSLNLFVVEYVADFVTNLSGSIEAGIAGGAVILISARLLFLMFKRRIKDTTVNHNELGDIKVTLKAINKLVKSVAREEVKVKEISSNVKTNKSGGVKIAVNLTVPFGTNITELTGFLQQKIKDQITESTGAKVEEVKILVEEISKDEVEED